MQPSVVRPQEDAQEEIEVREKTASKTLKRWDLLVTRLNPLGPTGGPEIEIGAMLIPPMQPIVLVYEGLFLIESADAGDRELSRWLRSQEKAVDL